MMAKQFMEKLSGPEAVEARRKFGRFPRFDGYMLPPFHEFMEDTEAKMKSLQKLECRDDDIFLCTYPKSGTNWANEFLEMLVKGKAQYGDGSLANHMVEVIPVDMVSANPSPRIISFHIPYRHLPEQHIGKNIKIVHMVRNPKDVYVSFYCFQCDFDVFKTPELEGCPGTWEHYINKTLQGEYNFYDGWCNYEKEFEQAEKENKNIFTLYYEDMKRNPEFELERLAKFLAVPYTQQLLSDIASLTEFKKQKTTVIETGRGDAMMKPDGASILYRKGQIGDWKNWFTVAQNEMFDKMLDKEMANSHVKRVFE